MTPWLRLASTDIIRDRWIRLRADRCQLASGQIIEPYYVMEEPEWVHVVALNAAREILLVRQYRYAGNAPGYELPGGTSDAGEELLVAAQRELLEETGCVAENWRHVGGAFANPARQNNRIHCFLAENATIAAPQKLDATEEIAFEFVPPQRVLDLIAHGEINQMMHVGMLHLAFAHLGWIATKLPQ